MGDPRNKDTFIGPLINDTHYKLVDSMIFDAVDKGAELLCGGAITAPTMNRPFCPASRLRMTIFHEECFGPVTAVIKAENWYQALKLCNDSKYGSRPPADKRHGQNAHDGALMESGAVHVNSPTFTLNKLFRLAA
jgi:aldehyde dehydrogenase (NAD+)